MIIMKLVSRKATVSNASVARAYTVRRSENSPLPDAIIKRVFVSEKKNG